ncbi:MAG TPA: hypothetical protein VK028_15560 [Micromonosporaceae bacterium]|nr:hypothetical protein [Micromonosporaceae bacterium]
MTAPEETPGGLAESTGHPRVDEAIVNLASVQDAPPAEQVGPLTEADRTFRETLDSIGDV